MVDILGFAPAAIITAVFTYGGTVWAYRDKIRAQQEEARDKREETADRLKMHNDELAFELLKSARVEIGAARIEIEELRGEVNTLRALESHFYHFQQALEHLEAILNVEAPEERAMAERNARAFLIRMRRLQTAKGTIRNEIQSADSAIEIANRKVEGASND